MRIWIAIGLVVVSLGPARAQIVPPPTISLRVEQPAYTGMPVWLHVTARDQCFEHKSPRSSRAEYLWLRQDGAEVTLDGHPVPRTPFAGTGLAQQFWIPDLLPCVTLPAQGPEHDHVFALNGSYVFDKPGHYAVRWVTKDRNFLGAPPEDVVHGGRGNFYMKGAASSPWIEFDVLQSTQSQREAWLAGLLAVPPDDDDLRTYDTIPALLAAWRDPRVTRALLDMMCEDTKGVSEAALLALNYDLDKSGADYFASLAEKGCVGVTFIMTIFVHRHDQELAHVRSRLLHSFAAPLNSRFADAPRLIAAVAALKAVRNDVPASDDGQQDNEWADEQVVSAGPKYFARYDHDGMNYSQILQDAVVSYFDHKDISAGAHDLLRKLATEGIVPLAAFEALEHLHDPADLMVLGTTIVNLRGMLWGNYLTDLREIGATFGVQAAPMWRSIAAKSSYYELRIQAEFELMDLGQPDAEHFIDASARSDDWLERRSALRGLDQLMKRGVKLGSLAHYCTGSDQDDPCHAKEVTAPPGQCEPHIPCVPRNAGPPLQ